jgi:hypothetical protein
MTDAQMVQLCRNGIEGSFSPEASLRSKLLAHLNLHETFQTLKTYAQSISNLELNAKLERYATTPRLSIANEIQNSLSALGYERPNCLANVHQQYIVKSTSHDLAHEVYCHNFTQSKSPRLVA